MKARILEVHLDGVRDEKGGLQFQLDGKLVTDGVRTLKLTKQEGEEALLSAIYGILQGAIAAGFVTHLYTSSKTEAAGP